ncbi:hypothetical protein [Streptomyces sp. NPDC058045]|uniref:hypothetical protein n=1 Tax=Streptomyces sp. NPDC058045 TaxID=3346311 RepID=UPI0036E06C46
MSQTTRPWFDSLTASVHALGAAAREYRMAHQAAQATAWQYDPSRLRPTPGSVHVVGRHYLPPHDNALWTLRELHAATERRTKEFYENTALAYAYGAAAATTAVLDGECPCHLTFERRDLSYVLDGATLPEDLPAALGDWPDGPNLAALREIVTEHLRARQAVRELSFYEDLSDCADAEFAEASEYAAGLADAAYAYGAAAERALQFVLLSGRMHDAAQEAG